MDSPLGRAAGNGLEVTEAVTALEGGGPEDLMELTLALAREMLDLAGVEADPAEAIEDGSALDKYREMVAAQGGDPHAPIAEAPEKRIVPAPAGGFVTRLDARAVGVAAWRLGAGRSRKEDPVSAGAGVVCLAKPGDEVSEGEALLELHADDAARFAAAERALEGAIEIGPEPAPPQEMIFERIRP
jgi:thymidine phosphorylase